jgi:hypothetical protein
MAGLDSGESFSRQRLDAGENVTPFGGLVPSKQQFAERGLCQHLLIHAPCLGEDLPAVCDKQQRQVATVPIAHEAAIVQCGDHRLPGPGGGHD